MFNSKNPVMFSVMILVIVMVITMVILYFTKPKFVVREDSMKKEVAWDKLVAYSALSGVIIAILALLYCEIVKKGRGMSSFGRKSRFGYCGM